MCVCVCGCVCVCVCVCVDDLPSDGKKNHHLSLSFNEDSRKLWELQTFPFMGADMKLFGHTHTTLSQEILLRLNGNKKGQKY